MISNECNFRSYILERERERERMREKVLLLRPLAKPLRLSLTNSRAGRDKTLCGGAKLHCRRSRLSSAELRRRRTFRNESARLRKIAMGGAL